VCSYGYLRELPARCAVTASTLPLIMLKDLVVTTSKDSFRNLSHGSTPEHRKGA